MKLFKKPFLCWLGIHDFWDYDFVYEIVVVLGVPLRIPKGIIWKCSRCGKIERYKK